MIMISKLIIFPKILGKLINNDFSVEGSVATERKITMKQAGEKCLFQNKALERFSMIRYWLKGFMN